MKTSVRVGVVGAGRMGQRHCRVYANLRRAELAGVFDLDPKIGEQVAGLYDVPFYGELSTLLEHVDALSLATPTALHFDQSLECLLRGVHLLIEKPITATLDQAEILARAADDSGRVVLVGHIERFNPAYIELKNVLTQIRPLAVNLRRLSPFEGSNTDVDVVLDLMIHDTNLILDLLGREPVTFSAQGLTAFSGALDHAVAQLCFEDGPLVTLTASRVTEHKIRSIEVAAREAYLECDLLNRSVLAHRATIGEYQNNNLGFRYRQESMVERIYVPNFESLFLELQHFIACILDGKTPEVTARNGLDALRWAIRIRDTALQGLIDANRQSAGSALRPEVTAQPGPD